VTHEARPHPNPLPEGEGADPRRLSLWERPAKRQRREPGEGAYREALDYLAGFVDVERGGVPAGAINLDRIRQLLAALGEPQHQYPSVLIAGTKGKGSTAARAAPGTSGRLASS